MECRRRNQPGPFQIQAAIGPAARLAAIGDLDAARLASYQPYHAARADLLARAGRVADAVAAYDEAIVLTTDPVERHVLTEQRRRVAVARGGGDAYGTGPATVE